MTHKNNDSKILLTSINKQIKRNLVNVVYISIVILRKWVSNLAKHCMQHCMQPLYAANFHVEGSNLNN